jgi:hypothetical protein
LFSSYSRRRALGGALLAVLLSAGVAAADIQLPEPRMAGGIGVFDALKLRASAPGNAFPTGAISPEELSTLLWAATGLNRPEKGWTVPMGMGREPYCRVYVAGAEGTFLYDWNGNVLKEISKSDIRDTFGAQSFVAKAPYVLIFVADGKSLRAVDSARGGEWAQVAVGAMTQNVYLAAEALNIGVRYMASLKADAARTNLKLARNDIPICILPAGKKQ